MMTKFTSTIGDRWTKPRRRSRMCYLGGYSCEQTLSVVGWGGWTSGSGLAENWSPFSGMPYIGGGYCFTAGTQVVIGAEFDENDSFVQYITKNIEDIKVGDLVYCYNTETETVEQKEVTAVFVREIDHINYLTIEDENGNIQVIKVSDVHPFWVVTDDPDLERAARDFAGGMYHQNIEPTEHGFWVEAKDLREGDVFLGANGELSTLVAIERVELEESITVYNFTVEGNHNYFVIAVTDEFGQTSVLVHNGGGKGIPQGKWHVQDENGNTYSGWNSESLLALIKHLDNGNVKIRTLIVKGHGDSAGVYDDNWTPLMYSEGGSSIVIGGEDVTKILKNITDNNTSIGLRGCNTKAAAKSVAHSLPGVHTSGSPMPILGIPFTPYSIGPWRNYNVP